MRSGNRRRRLPDSAWAAISALAIAVLVVSCGSGNRFDRSLARLDELLGRLPFPNARPDGEGPVNVLSDPDKVEELVVSTARRAESLSDWLRLMSRAFRASEATGDAGIAARTADRARKAYPSYEDIALCACRAYIDAGRSADAMELFPVPLDPLVHGRWFSEAFLQVCKDSGRETRGSDNLDVLRILSEHTGRGEPAIDAALLRMGAGDPGGAASFLRYAKDLGAVVDPDLAWDAGALDMLLEDPERDTEGRSLLRKAEAALLLGERDWALDYLLDLVLSFPDHSWKPYVALASLEKEPARSDYWHERMMEVFPGDPQVLRVRASYLARTGKGARALAELESLGANLPGDSKTAVLSAEIRSRVHPTEPVYARALSLSNAFPDDPDVQLWALGRLAASDRYVEAAELYRQLQARGVELGRPWYFEALARILEGRIEDAVDIVEREGPAEGGTEAPFALGVLYASLGRYPASVERFKIAASAASEPEGKARALVEMGKSLAASGETKKARETWASALSICPDSAEALRLYNARQKIE